jgi:HSP20 family molecular chaperone IbpA
MTLSVKSSARQAQWRPFREFENLYAQMDRLAQSVFSGLTGDGAWLPAADVVETDSAYVIEIELPGVRREDVDVKLNGNELVVTGEVKERKREGLFRRRTDESVSSSFVSRCRVTFGKATSRRRWPMACSPFTYRRPRAPSQARSR